MVCFLGSALQHVRKLVGTMVLVRQRPAVQSCNLLQAVHAMLLEKTFVVHAWCLVGSALQHVWTLGVTMIETSHRVLKASHYSTMFVERVYVVYAWFLVGSALQHVWTTGGDNDTSA